MCIIKYSVALSLLAFVSLGAVIDTEGLPDTGLDTTSWVLGKVPPLDDIFNLHDMQLAAKNALSRSDYELHVEAFYRTGALDDMSTFILVHYRRFSNDSSIASNKTTIEIGAAAASGQIQFRQLYPWSNTTRLENDLKEYTHAQNFDLAALAALQKQTLLPIIPKGISNWQDVKLLHSLGFPACYISNHGGRLIDGQQTAAEVLLDLRKNAPEVLDDPMFANIWGEAGVDKLISILTTELSSEMKLIGVTSLLEVNSTVVNTKIIENWLD
ncbi:unnamed protein product [Rhizoctonia solani]|uniref:FMN-dependent dehydrogenase domain-containing protein n=1 Tax=Rhizoctonia solani TaxID=456999 RepID=A0A8H3HFA4_9AGAM|nr:unnamed protein product [Rhizoctonia solani]